ncbi:MAG: hypothetical protein GC191_05005 [Azospirillum sp.]|nr:hypothetical protein [Azospirillum sp.]
MPLALLRSFAQLSDPAVRRVLWIGVVLALAAFAGIGWAVWRVLDLIDPNWAWWLPAALKVVGELGVSLLAWLLFPGVAGGISSFLLDDVLNAVERRHYPTLPPPRRSGLGEEIAGALRFIGVVVALNLLVLPLYLVPGLNLLVFYGLNGYVLGREYFELAAIRRLDLDGVRKLRRRQRLVVFAAGLIIAVLSTIPVVNLLVPVVASAFMVHVFHRLNRDPA